MNALIPTWIIGGPFVGLLILLFSFKGPSSMGGPGMTVGVTDAALRYDPRDR